MNQVKAHNATHNEGGYGYNPFEQPAAQRAHDAAEARMADLMSRAAEVRAAWNAAVAKYATAKGVSMLDMPKIEKMTGVTQNEIGMMKARGAFAVQA